tara:strand:+ start:615 stop:731 length:117 start_codon:yes stop_codon:yes gene_type:complete
MIPLLGDAFGLVLVASRFKKMAQLNKAHPYECAVAQKT